MARSNDLDIRPSADRITTLFNANRSAEALALLEERRQNQPEAVQDALDRYVGVGASASIATHLHGAADPAATAALQRLQTAATAQPRFPAQTQIATLSDAQTYDVYASIVQVRGNDAAHDALSRANERVVLGLRQENSTLAAMEDRQHSATIRDDDPATPNVNEAQAGTGVYNDRLVVLWKDADGTRHVQGAEKANTEPTAQYDHHAGNTGHRPRAEGGVENRTFAPSPGYESIARPRKIEGDDVNADGIRDLGRLSDGTIEMQMGQHPNPTRPGTMDNALRPSQAAVAAGHGAVQRDTNADGWFNQTDVNGVQDLNDTFKIHRGSSGSTDSAGCQTIHPTEYQGFINAVQGNPAQTRWQYVLTSTTPGPVREQQRDQGQQQEDARPGPARQDGRAPQEHHRPEGRPAEPPHGGQRRAEIEPAQQAEPHPLYAQANTRVGQLDASIGRSSDEHSASMSASLALLAKEHGLERIDHVLLSNQTPRAAAAPPCSSCRASRATRRTCVPACLRTLRSIHLWSNRWHGYKC
ncbi:XVIPCD domain-containing protein [Xanthomonas sp. CFBP 8443]|uniref:XVIPCD domain-containing protein n=1 Tax=unclassified Xanthomonas TaxID=2643310 RepID=UPI002958B8C8|nr:XVIPCD domain-containing protein [Xanthomonas sp. CFBP 8443]